MVNKVIHYNSWTEWNMNTQMYKDNILYSGPTVECPIKEIKNKNHNYKYIIILK